LRPSGGNSHLRKRGPAPLRAGSSLLVHDLKNLASRLSNLGQNLNHRYEDPLFKQSALDLLDDTAHHLQRLAGDLREHEGRLMVKLRTDLNQVLADSLSDARPDLRPEVEVVTKYTPLEPIWGDAYLLRRAFACAIENALEAMARGPGTLSLRTSLRLRGGEKHPTVEIADTGEGMDREFVRNWLFRPFATTKEDGLGLGAYTMRQVARIHGGSLKVRSKPASGTVVSFVFSSEESA
jgi:signal transduction histidine kinase